MAYELIETIEVGAGGAASIEFTSIPQDGVDLVCVLSARNDGATTASSALVRFNNDSGSNYTMLRLYGDGSSVTTNLLTSLTGVYHNFSVVGNSATSNTFGNSSLYISNYTSSSAKSVSNDGVTENNATAARQVITAQSWSGTSAISTITLTTFTNFLQYSTASLYKIY